MATSIETQSISKSGVPYWALDHMFKQVRVVKDFDENNDGRFIYRAGYVGLLNDIRSQGDRLFAGVQFMDGDGGVDIPFEHIERFVDPYMLIPGRASQIAIAWRAGMNMRERLSKSTFHRYRKILLEYGIDLETKTEPSM
jgi:hypothetical protein